MEKVTTYDCIAINDYVKMSPQIDLLAAALAKAQGSFKEPKKDAQNPHFNSSFASLHSLREAAEPFLAANALSVTQHPISYPGGIVGVVTILSHSSGQWMSSEFKVKAKDESAQPMGGSVTYTRRYAYASILGLAAVEDDDGNNASLPQHSLPAKAYEGLPAMDTLSDKMIDDYVIDLGPKSRLTGKHLYQVSAQDIKEQLAFWATKGQLTGKPYIFCKNAEAYLKAAEKPKAAKEDYPPFLDTDDPNF